MNQRLLHENYLAVASIEQGTVIDHIAQGKALLLLRLLKLESYPQRVFLGLNLYSARMKAKDMIKIESRELTPKETMQIAIFSPQTTINIIHNYRVVEKFTVALPEKIEQFIICPNPQCITNHEATKRCFSVKYQRQMIKLQCAFCEKSFYQHEITYLD